MKIKNNKSYKIVWEDAYGGWHKWTHIDSLLEGLKDPETTYTVVSYGRCVHKDRKVICLAQNTCDKSETHSDIMVIPRGMIKEILEIA